MYKFKRDPTSRLRTRFERKTIIVTNKHDGDYVRNEPVTSMDIDNDAKSETTTVQSDYEVVEYF